MVGGEGIEPSLSCENQILSLARLPVPPLAQRNNYTTIKFLYKDKTKLPRAFLLLCAL